MMTTTDDDGTAPAVGEYAAWSAKLADLLDQAGFVPEPGAGLPVASACQITTPAGPWVFGGDAAVVAVSWDPDEHPYEGPQVAVECDQWSVLFSYGTDPAVIAAVAERMAWDEHGQDEDPAALARVLTSVGFALTTTYPDGEAIPATDQPTWMRVYYTDSNEPQAAFVSPASETSGAMVEGHETSVMFSHGTPAEVIGRMAEYAADADRREFTRFSPRDMAGGAATRAGC